LTRSTMGRSQKIISAQTARVKEALLGIIVSVQTYGRLVTRRDGVRPYLRALQTASVALCRQPSGLQHVHGSPSSAFGESYATTSNGFLFESNRRTRYATRAVQSIGGCLSAFLDYDSEYIVLRTIGVETAAAYGTIPCVGLKLSAYSLCSLFHRAHGSALPSL
jgi:hypothetical protein